MSLEKTTAIVLRVVEFSETSCIVTMMTRDHGKITAMAKGARRPKSSFEAALDVLSICRIVFLQKSSGSMDLLTEAKLERRFRCASSSLNRLYAGYYVAELLKLLTDDADLHPDLFDLAVSAIEAIDDGKQETRGTDSLDRTVLNFELNSLRMLGHLPMLTQCVSCGREKKTLSRVSFGMNAGGILCQTCRPGERSVINLSSDGLAFLLKYMDYSKSNLKQLENRYEHNGNGNLIREADEPGYEIDSKDSKVAESNLQTGNPIPEVRGLLRSYITHLVGYPPRLQKFLNTDNKRSVVSVH